MNKVTFVNKTKENIEEQRALEGLINYAIKKEHLKNIEFGVIFVENEEIHKLNKEYRGVDRATDVITFALEDNEDNINEDYRLLGDVYISIEKAKEQALLYDHSYLRELSFLLIHGFLHLLGYDHMEEEEEKIMFERQEEILNGYGIKKA